MAKLHDVTKCEVCGKTLPDMSKAATCSDKCRKRKSRYADVGNLAMIARQNIRQMIKGLDLDVVDTVKMQDEYYALQDLMSKLAESYNARWDREHNAPASPPAAPAPRTRKGRK